MHFIKNGFRRFSKTNSTDPRQRVPLKERACIQSINVHVHTNASVLLHSCIALIETTASALDSAQASLVFA